MEDVLRGRTIVEAYHAEKKFIMKLDDGSEVVIEEKSGAGCHYDWDNWTDITHQKDGRILSSWRLESKPPAPKSIITPGAGFTSEF